MRTKILFWWDELREKMWFIPSVYALAAIVAALASLSLDKAFELGTERLLPFLETTGDSGRIILGSLVGALVTVMGLVFSLTMLSVSQTSSQYGPRLIRSVFDSNIAQNTIGVILATVVYCMLVLRSIRDVNAGDSLFTPHLSILLAELAGALCIFALLAFTNHVTRCMRAETLIQSIYSDLKSAARNLFPEVIEVREADSVLTAKPDSWKVLENASPLVSDRSGYLQAIELKGMLSRAQEHCHRLEVLRRAGDFVYEGEELALIELSGGDHESDQDAIEDYRAYFLLGTVRTPRQDIEAGVLELVEAGVRALSPGVNDPMTAINVIDYVSSFLRFLAGREWPLAVLTNAEGEPVVKVDPVSYRSILNAGFDQLRQYAGNSVAVNCRLLEALAAIATATRRSEDRLAVGRQAEMILRAAERNISEPEDLSDIQQRAEKVRSAIDEASGVSFLVT